MQQQQQLDMQPAQPQQQPAQRPRRRCAEACMESLANEAVRFFSEREYGPAAPAALEAVGYRMGRQLAERCVPGGGGADQGKAGPD
jgi:hypothetical protein